MSKLINSIPDDFDSSFLTETQSMTEPTIRREGSNIIFPALIRKTEETYHYFDVPMKYTGQDISDYDKCKLQSYSPLRAFFYGPVTVQLEQQLKGTFAKHQYAVRMAFPKTDGEVPEGVIRFNEIKAEFWGAIDAILEDLGKTREDLPEQPFNAETMIAWAIQQGVSAEDIAKYVQTFSVVSLNLLHNGRIWNELFF